MKQSNVQEIIAATIAQSGAFYRCVSGNGCGMRFPVAPGDKFRGVCPRCGGVVERVATVEQGAQLDRVPERLPPSQLKLLLDNWRSLFNVGAAFRSADGAGIGHLYLCGITATPASHPKVAKTALGAEQSVGWSYHDDAVLCGHALRSEGNELWVLERNERAANLFDISELPQDTSVVLAGGNEVLGVDPGLVEMADRVVQLPMGGSKDSLNVAIALSITAYWLRAIEIKQQMRFLPNAQVE
jgi:tRNA G18 (ribose-2'-O)-methylase SpoU